MSRSGVGQLEKIHGENEMKTFTLLVLVVVVFMVTGCNGSGSGGSTAKGGCLSLVKMLR